MRASGAIATTATHAGSAACIAARQTRQVAHQAAATKGLRSVAQHSTRQGNLVLTIHNPTTERDLRPLKQGEYRHSTSHRHLAAANAEMLQALQRRPGVTVTLRVDAGAPPACLMQEAEDTARSGDLRPMKYVGDATHARSLWDQSRVWDPGD